jgi:hypothetical protein
MDNVLKGCLSCLTTGAGAAVVPQPPDAVSVLTLALLAAEDCHARGQHLWEKTAQRAASWAERVLPRFRLWQVVLECEGTELADAAKDLAIFAKTRRQADRFELAILPERLSKLVGKPQDLRQRVRLFLERSGDLPAFRTHLRAILRATLSDADADRLLDEVQPSRLGTLSERMLAEMAANFARWGSVVRYLRDPHARAQFGTALDEEFRGCRERWICYLKSQWCDRDGYYEIEEAVNEVLGEGLLGYTYESGLPTWLTAVVLNRLREGARSGSRSKNDAEQCAAAETAAPIMWTECLLQWALRFRLVQTTFRPKVQPLARLVWGAMLSHWSTGRKPSNPELAAKISRRLQAVVTPLKVSTCRRRIRQRMDVLRHLLDEVEHDEPDLPGDESALDSVERRYGLDDKDVPTLRHLAALARVGRAHRNAAWGLLAALLVDEKLPPDQAELLVRHLAGKDFAAALDGKRDRLSRLQDHKPARGRCLGSLRRGRLLFFATALLWLVVVERADCDSVTAVLNPATRELEPVRVAAQGLQELFAKG